MIYPEKTYTNNPFVDNVIYYAKWLSMNCTVKDEEEALANETKETREAGDILISCVEGASSYELYKSIPKEIIEKYIQVHSNLDLYVESVGSLKLHLDHYDEYNKNKIINSLSETARNVFIDHYDTVTAYLESLEIKSEFDEYEELIDFVRHNMSWNSFFNMPEYHEQLGLVFDKCIPEDRKEAIDSNLSAIIPDDVNTEIYNDFNIFYAFIKDLRDNKYYETINNVDTERFPNLGSYLDEGITLFISDLQRAYEKVYEDINSRYTDDVKNTYNWLDAYANLYEKCKLDYIPEDNNYTLSYEALISAGNDADIKELYNVIPEYTRTRVIKTYLNNSISSSNDIYASYDNFKNHVISRTDITQINAEISYIIMAFRKIFISHYDIMADRKYFSLDIDRNAWARFINDDTEYENCKKGYSSYKTLFDLFPSEAIRSLLIRGLDGSERINIQDIDQFELDTNLNNLIEYITINKDNIFASELSKDMRKVYIDNYTSYLNYDIYLKCKHDTIDYFELIPYLPFETQKMILNTEIEEFTNIQVYADSKRMLNSYLSTLPIAEANRIKYNINKDMKEWYPKNHIEKNNYYRSLIGLPPIDKAGNVYEDTLYHTWNETTGSFIEFGDRFIKLLPKDIYPEIHWKQNIYEFDAYDIGILNQYNILDDYIIACGANPSTPRYKYLRYLADNKLDLYTCRKALKYDLIGVPTIDDNDAKKRFVDNYVVNKDYVIRTVYSEAHKFQSDYYDKFMIIFILINTIMDMLSGITEMIIDREVFDARCIEWLFESYGVPYYSEIPIKYLRAMLKNLNTLLKYKSSTKNMIDICNLFGFNDVKVFGYYLFKDRNVDSVTGEYLFDDPTEITYNINEVWVKVPDQSPVIDDAVSILYPAYALLNTDNTYTDLLTLTQGTVDNNGISTNNDTSLSYFSSIFNIDNNKYLNIMLNNNIKYKIYQFDESSTLISTSNEFNSSYSYRLNDNTKSARIYFYDLVNIEDIKYIEHISLSIDNKTYTDTDKMVKVDFNGVLYMNLEDYIRYNEYEKDKYIKYIGDIETESNEHNNDLEIVNNDADVYIYDQYYNEFIPLKDTHYFTKIKADTSPSTLKFIKVPIDDELSKYKNDPNYILSYDEITKSDEGDTWDGGLDHDDLKNKLLDHEFNAVKSKYISVETVTDLTEQSFQVAYFYNMLFDNLYNEDGLTVDIPYLKIGHTFRFMDIICYLFALMYLYHGLEDNIMYSPTQILYVKGYNFDEALNQISDTILSYNASDANLDINNLDAKEKQKLINYFDINKEINKRNYNYQKQFDGYTIKEFNLEADIDELDKWLQEYTQMSLDDFIVDDTLINFSQIITLRQFFTLNNSYYQKDIFNKTNIIPFNYNQEISYAYDYYLLDKKVFYDFDGLKHYYACIYDNTSLNKAALIIDNTDDVIYKLYLNAYITFSDGNAHSLYKRYTANSDKSIYNDFGSFYCYDSDTNSYYILFDNAYFIINKNNDIIFSADNFYIKNKNDEYELINESHEIYGNNFTPAANYSYNRRYRLSLGLYWIQNEDGSWKLDNNYVYFKVKKGNNNEYEFVNYFELSEHSNVTINEDDYYIRHDDGHFVKFTETDYYRFNSKDDIKSIYDYIKENSVYIRVSENDNYNYTDTELDGSVYYYKDATEYLSENNWNYIDKIYVKVSDNTYIPEDELLSPSNLYFYKDGNYELVYNNIATYTYSGPYTYIDNTELNNITNGLMYTLILSNNGKYNKYGDRINDVYGYAGSSGIVTLSNEIWNFDTRTYLLNSNNDYITVLKDIDDTSNYLNTKSFIVILQKEVTYSSNIDELSSEKYNPEITDKVWDENDWFYPKDGEASSDIGLHGENIWYYRDPNNPNQETEEDQIESKVGSGFFIESSSYLGSTQLESGNKYYMAFDLETNFSGEIQIYNTADNSVSSINDRLYKVTKGEKIHISQIFIANEIANPEIRLLIYNFDKYPINIGDYIVISNMRFVKATAHEDKNNPGYYNSNHYIAQDVPSYDMLQELYRTNEAIYKWLCTEMAKESDLRKYNILKKIYDSLMVSKYNKEAFKIGENKYAKTYTDFLENRDAVLYSKLVRFKSIDPDTMHKEIADEIIEVTYAIDDCVDTYSYGFIYSYFPAVSATYIQQYITKIINWFKSWKVHLLGINTVYKLGDEYENSVKALETKEPRVKIDHYKKNVHIYDTVKINPIDEINSSGEKYVDLYPDMVEYSHIPKDECIPKDRVRIISRIADKIEFKDNENNMHITFNDNGTKVSVSNDNILNISSGEDGFSTNNDNELILTTEKTIDQYYAEQIIDEINLLSGDYLDRRNVDNE